MTTVNIEGPIFGGHTRFAERVEGWPGAGFRHRITEMKVRRVIDTPDKAKPRNELQIEIVITSVFNERSRDDHGSLTLGPKEIEALRAALDRVS